MKSIIEPSLTGIEKKYYLDAFKKNQISTYGPYPNKLEKRVSQISNSKYNLALTSGSVALYLAFKTIGLKKNDMVITTSYTFAATTSAIQHIGSTPLLVDISLKTFCIDIDQLENYLKTQTIKIKNYTFSKKLKKRIYAICVVLTFSIIPDLKKIFKISKKYNLKIVIDGACALGAFYKQIPLTKLSDIVIYSLNGNKTFTSGGGGILSTDKKQFYSKSKLLASNAKINQKYEYSFPAHNFKITNIHAALGYGQLTRFKSIIKKKKIIQTNYEKNLKFKREKFLPKTIFSDHVLWINALIVDDKKKYTLIKKKLLNIGYKIDMFWKPMHLQKFSKKFNFLKMKNTNYCWDKILTLPSSSNLNQKDQKKIIKSINEIY
jgi:perosamine synthetase